MGCAGEEQGLRTSNDLTSSTTSFLSVLSAPNYINQKGNYSAILDNVRKPNHPLILKIYIAIQT